MSTFDLDYHGDQAVGPGLADFAVNVRTEPPPDWLTSSILAACRRLAGYPDPSEGTGAVAEHHGRDPGEVLLTAGAAEAFGLIARALPARSAVVVHPQFTEPERALRLAGHQVGRHVLTAAEGFALDPAAVPSEADVVVVGNPTNPTGVLHRASDLLALTRPGRVVVVDEAFMDAVPGEPESLASLGETPGLVVVRSLTKTWGLAGLRVGYVLAPASLVEALRRQQPPWSVSTPAIAAATACASRRGRREADQRAVHVDQWRSELRAALEARGLPSVAGSRGPFLLAHVPPGCAGNRLVDGLRGRGVAVRRCDTFPGLGADWLRVAVRPPERQAVLLRALDEVMTARLSAVPEGVPSGAGEGERREEPEDENA